MTTFHILWIYCLISICHTDILPGTIGHVYNHMSYNCTGSSLAQLVIKNKLLCAAQCAQQFVTCNTAVFDSSTIPQCLLYNEVLMPANLIVSPDAVVYDFLQNKFKGRKCMTIATVSEATNCMHISSR
jgi:hypothetical protein